IPVDVPVGIMIEVPSAVLVLHHLVQEVDFVSVGTNDLVQYLLAVDRDNPWVSKLYDVHHPAVMLALAQVARIARAAGKPCSVCGEMAGDYATALALMGMGYDGVSVVPSLLSEVKFAVRESTHEEAVQIATDALAESTSEGVRRVLIHARDRLHRRQIEQRGDAELTLGSDTNGDSKK